MTKPTEANNSIAFQGLPGAYSHKACVAAFPAMGPLACPTFEDAFSAVREGRARYAMIPIDNTLAGRVADVHHLLPYSGLHIVGEHFERINHHLLAPRGATLESIKTVESHVHALGQCRNLIRRLGLTVIVGADTAGAAAELAKSGDLTKAAIASELAAEIYGLQSLQANIEDAEHNTTRFVVLAREAVEPNPNQTNVTTFVFRVRNVPAALYKALGGFATNGVNITKLESYLVGGGFVAAQFYMDVEGHPAQRNLRLALEELEFFSHEVRILGVYPAHPVRATFTAAGE
ncbi:prephenate dehydratase [Magnetospirillum sulfuroxidans]|uniref:prephenate dehydratase n=1 Tax=Magnetospirillum sulfuroxidans TaxID=611300 RepID=A0ABS5ID64_9PROT|nr:prephenate dehydratase [Magnetospirillum sulfuroxidans]MBR9972367.1 prephenate dehydratase [Magnetospirillum sulfuroxidans]